jgi:hypothetical protein
MARVWRRVAVGLAIGLALGLLLGRLLALPWGFVLALGWFGLVSGGLIAGMIVAGHAEGD